MSRRAADMPAVVRQWLTPYLDVERSRELARFVEEECVALWRRTRIRYRTGQLHDTLTSRSHPGRRLDLRRGRFAFVIAHPALGAHPEYVPHIDLAEAFRTGWVRWARQRRARP